jgi:hypothetical protein
VDAIIANLLVPSALHCASRLDCHLHFMFPQVRLRQDVTIMAWRYSRDCVRIDLGDLAPDLISPGTVMLLPVRMVQPWAASSYLPHPLWGRGLALPAAPSLFTLATHVLLDELHHLAWRHAIDRLRDHIGLPRLYSADFGECHSHLRNTPAHPSWNTS